MSLINDALKRASEAKPPVDASVSAPALRPAEDPPRRTLWIWAWYAVGLMLAGFLASWAIIMGVVANHQLKANQLASAREVKTEQHKYLAPTKEVASEWTQGTVSALPGEEGEHQALAQANGQPSATNNQNATNSNTLSNAVAAAPMPVEAPKPAVPTLKLQGIIYRPAKPLAMINSKLFSRGDKVLNAKVMAIDRESVTLEQEGQTVVLTLP